MHIYCLHRLRQRNKQDKVDSAMAETVGDDDRKRLRAAENLGWLATSGTYSKKRKLIEGADLIYASHDFEHRT